MQGANGLSTASSSGVSFSPRGQPNAGREWLVTKRKGPREEENRKAKPVRFHLPALVWAQIFIEREMSGYEAGRTIDNNNLTNSLN